LFQFSFNKKFFSTCLKFRLKKVIHIHKEMPSNEYHHTLVHSKQKPPSPPYVDAAERKAASALNSPSQAMNDKFDVSIKSFFFVK
jgi:hypothetical protein